jgi:CheY-like chemotaxis protein
VTAERPTPLRILVVEDEALTSMVIHRLVEALGGSVVGPAVGVDEALRLIDSGNVNGAVLDVDLNGQPVYPVADRLSARRIPFVFLTAYGAEGVPPAHADRPVLRKPFHPPHVAVVLADALGFPSQP